MLGRADWLQAAIDNGEFLLRELRRPDGRWHRSWQADGTPPARHDALAADHAALVDAFTRLAEASGQARWIDAARETADVLLDHFWDVDHGGVFTTADDGEQLVARQKDILDNATPSANSTAANALTRLAALTGEMRYANHADRILQLLGTVIRQAPGGVSNALLGIETRGRGITEVAIVGDRPDLVRLTQSLFRPDVVLAWGERYDSPLWHERADGLAYVCRDYACEAPQDTAEGFFRQLTGQELPAAAHQPPRWMISFGRRRDRPVLRPGGSTPGSSHRWPSAIAPNRSRPGGMRRRWRSRRSPLNTPKNSAPSPTSSAASSSVITAIALSIVQYGAGHACVPAPSPVPALSGSE